MAKITRHGGPTVGSVRGRALLPGVAQVVLGQVAERPDDADPGEAVGGFLPPQGDEVDLEEDAWPGSSSSTSPAKPPKSDAPKRPSRPKRARTTGGRSKPTGASTTAPTAITNGPATDA